MSGYSWDWRYIRKLLGGVCIVSGGFLLMEHLFVFGCYDIEVLGHEYYGLALIIFGFLLNVDWRQLKDIRQLKDLIDEGLRKHRR